MRSDDSSDSDNNNDNDIVQVQIVCARNCRTCITTGEMEWEKCRRLRPKKYPQIRSSMTGVNSTISATKYKPEQACHFYSQNRQ
jgi:hypothetical protein